MTLERGYSRTSEAIIRSDFTGLRILILGLGSLGGGLAVAQYFAAQNCDVRITDLRDQDALGDSYDLVDGPRVTWVLGQHRYEDIDWADVVVRNPGVWANSPYLLYARTMRRPIEMEVSLFFRQCRSNVISITGTKGKTTTSTFLQSMLLTRDASVLLLGNMGVGSITRLADANDAANVVVELSSYQLEAFDDIAVPVRGPHVHVITNLGDDHLDRHGSYMEYARIKGSLARYQTTSDWLLAPLDDPNIVAAVEGSTSRLVHLGKEPPLIECVASVQFDWPDIYWHENGESIYLGNASQLKLAGRHNADNLLVACGAAYAAGLEPDVIAGSVGGLAPIAHRLEVVRVVGPIRFINDSAASAPVATMAALRALGAEGLPIVLIAGGSSKSSDYNSLADLIVAEVAELIMLDGTGSEILGNCLSERNFVFHSGFDSLDAATKRAIALSHDYSGPSIILLSPACASFGLFLHEFDRGEQFRKIVSSL